MRIASLGTVMGFWALAFLENEPRYDELRMLPISIGAGGASACIRRGGTGDAPAAAPLCPA